jgi:hypothetical protein
LDQKLTSVRLWTSIINLDLQLYKASIFKQRWGTPGGNDQALPCYDEALITLEGSEWPEALRDSAADLARRVAAFKETIIKKDVTMASATQTKMMVSFEDLREGVRYWPEPRPAAVRGSQGARDFFATPDVSASKSGRSGRA